MNGFSADNGGAIFGEESGSVWLEDTEIISCRSGRSGGAISLITAFYAFNMMPVDLTGAALIALGVLLVVAEAFVPSFGALGLGGVAALLDYSVFFLGRASRTATA